MNDISMQKKLIAWLWMAFVFWCAPAAAEALKDGVHSYDIESLMWAILISMVGGVTRTSLTVLSKNVVLKSVLEEAWKDLLIAAIAGMVAFVIIAAFNSVPGLPEIPAKVTILLLATAGWMRMNFFVWVKNAGARVSNSAIGMTEKSLGGLSRDESFNDDYSHQKQTRGRGRFTRINDDANDVR